MFKKLKDKIAEEVKISPQRFQQITQSVSDKLQASTPEESFFSIDDEASSSTTTTTANNEPGFTSVSLHSSTPMEPRQRRTSTASISSDVSFLPRYDSSNMYHLPSDIEASASEMEDNVSTTSTQFGHISKEQVYSQYQKARLLYHKYRGRYSDLAVHYKELERENGKMKAVLVETQDKAIRRVSELREQCQLEQTAKAHLENALRMEIDEKQITIETLRTKIDLLNNTSLNSTVFNVQDLENGNNTAGDQKTEIDGLNAELTRAKDELTREKKELTSAKDEITQLTSKLQELKATAIIFNSKETSYKTKITELETAREKLQESEAAFKSQLAKSEISLRTEIENKNLDITNLKSDLEVLKESLNSYESRSTGGTKMENLQAQNTKLIEKIESLTVKCNNNDAELLKMEQFRQENKNLSDTVISLKEINKGFAKELGECNYLKDKLEDAQKELEKIKLENSKVTESLEKLLEENEDYKVNSAKVIEDFKRISLENNRIVEELEKLQEENNGLIKNNTKLSEDFSDINSEFNHLDAKYNKLLIENTSLSDSLISKDSELEKVRNDAKTSLLTLESKITKKINNQFDQKTAKLQKEFDEKVKTLSVNSDSVKEIQIKLLNSEDLVKKLEESVKVLQKDLGASRTSFAEMESNYLGLIDENNDNMRIKVSLKEQLDHLGDSCKELERKYSGEVKSLQNLNNEVTKLQNEVASKEMEVGRLQSELVVKETFLSERDSFEKSLQTEIVHLKSIRKELEEKNCEIDREVGNLSNSFEELQVEAKNKVESYKKLELEKESLVGRLEDLDSKFKSLEIAKSENNVLNERLLELDRIKESSEGLQKENLVLTSEITNLQESLRKYKEDFVELQEENETNCRELSLSRESSEISAKNYLDEIAVLNNKNGDLLETLKGLTEEKDTFDKEISELKELREVFDKEIASMGEQVVELGNNRKTERNELSALNEALCKLTEEKNSLVVEKESCDNRIAELNMQVVALQESQISLEITRQDNGKEIEGLKKLLKQSSSRSEVLTELNEEKIKLQQENDALDKKVVEVESERVKLSEEISELSKERVALIEEKNSLIVEKESGNNEIVALNQKISEFNDRKERLNKQVLELQENLAGLTNTREEKDKEIDSLKSLLKQSNSQSEVLTELNEEKIKLQHDLEVATGKLEKTRLETAKQKQEIIELRILKDDLANTNEENAKLLSKISDLKCNLQTLVNERQQLRDRSAKYEEFSTKLDQSTLELTQKQHQLQQTANQLDETMLRNRQLTNDNTRLIQEVEQLSNTAVEHNLQLEELTGSDELLGGLREENVGLTRELGELRGRLEWLLGEKVTQEELVQRNADETVLLQRKLTELSEMTAKFEAILAENGRVKEELAEVRRVKEGLEEEGKRLEIQLRDLDGHYSEIKHENLLLKDEVQELKIAPLNITKSSRQPLQNGSNSGQENQIELVRELDQLREKIHQYKSIDLTNRSSIEFYENELLKSQTKNEKLSRKLDETLVTLGHCAELSGGSTEVEYLRNVLYNYMLGRESLVLARVIAAVCKFDAQQTDTVLKNEQQKQTLLGQLGIL